MLDHFGELCILTLKRDVYFSLIFRSSPLRVREAMMEPLSSRVLTLHIPVQEGLHWATPVLFDFCHRCAVGVVIHAQLWSLSQPKLWFVVSVFKK